MHRYIYGEDPASQADFHGIVIHELPEIELDNQTPLPLLRDIYALNNTSFDKILDFHTDVLFKKFPLKPSSAGKLLGLDKFENMLDPDVPRPDPNKRGPVFTNDKGERFEQE